MNDRWFLNAVTMVAAEEKQFNILTCSGIKAAQDARKQHQLFVFRFFKQGKPVFVIVDNMIPTYELVDGTPRPFFARCGNPLLFWVQLVEKAYAKLHGRYYALHGGSTDEALEDLLGVVVENCFIDDGTTMTDKTSLFNTLRTLTFNHAIVGCKLDLEMFTWMEASAKKKHYAKAIALGI